MNTDNQFLIFFGKWNKISYLPNWQKKNKNSLTISINLSKTVRSKNAEFQNKYIVSTKSHIKFFK